MHERVGVPLSNADPLVLPDADTIFGSHIEGITRLHAKGLVPSVDVPNHAIDPVEGR